MIGRRLDGQMAEHLAQFPAVALLGPRQVGKTTLARALTETRSLVYLDLESPQDREKLSDAALYLEQHREQLVVLDEIQRVPELFHVLRGVIDAGRRDGLGNGRFLLLGSASMELLAQSGESLAGRIAYLELCPFDPLEVERDQIRPLWLRGGFPESFLARTDRASSLWRRNFIRTYLERDIPQLGPRVPAETLRRFWTMLAHSQGGLLNAAAIARGLAVDGKTVARYLDLMVDLLLVRRLPPYHINVKKRLVKAPKTYVRDSGVLHSLLQLDTLDDVLGHPIAGASWEGFVVEALLRAAPERAQASFYRTTAGAEIDLLLEVAGKRWAIEIKSGSAPKLQRGFHLACEDVQPHRSFVVHAGSESFPLRGGVEAVTVWDLAAQLAALA